MESRKDSPIVILTRALPPAVIGAMVIQVALIIGGLMIGSVFLGLFVDARMGTRPLFTLILALLSLPVSVWLTYRLAMKTVTKARIAYDAYLESKRVAAEQPAVTTRSDPLASALESERP